LYHLDIWVCLFQSGLQKLTGTKATDQEYRLQQDLGNNSCGMIDEIHTLISLPLG
jgi:hypothetical protein